MLSARLPRLAAGLLAAAIGWAFLAGPGWPPTPPSPTRR